MPQSGSRRFYAMIRYEIAYENNFFPAILSSHLSRQTLMTAYKTCIAVAKCNQFFLDIYFIRDGYSICIKTGCSTYPCRLIEI